MGKIVKGLIGIAIIAVVIFNPVLLVNAGLFFGVSVGTTLGALGTIAAFGGALALSSLSALSQKKPVEGNALTEQRLNKSVVPETPRKIIFGETAAPLDIRYWEVFGTDNNSYDEVIAVAGHEVQSFGKFFLEDKEHTFSGAGTSNILGTAFKRFTRTVGVTGTRLTAGAGFLWTTNASMTGMAFMVLKYVHSQEKWPQGFPNKVTQVVKGALVYDPRLDSTVAGGTGTHRIDDQLTWQYNDGTSDIGRNPALQMLWYLIGWRVSGFLVCGMGVKTTSINLVEFIQAANDAEAQSFESDCALSTGDEHETNIGIIESTCGGRLLDTGGIYTFKIAIDDTATIAVAFDDNDVVGAIQWVPAKKMRDQVNVFTGVYVEPNDLYQLRSFPEVSDAAFIASDGFERRSNNRFVAVQDALQAQKLSRILLNQTRFQGVFKAAFSYKAMLAKNWDIVTLSLVSQGWTNELFRIIQYDITTNGIILLTLEQTDSSIYVGGATSTPPVGTGTAWDPRAKIPLLGLLATAVVITGEGQSARDALRVTFTLPTGMVLNTVVEYRVVGDTDFILAGVLTGDDNSLDITPLTPNTSFDVRAKHISITDVPGDFVSIVGTTGNGTILDFDNLGGLNADSEDWTADDEDFITADRPGNPASDATCNNICEQPDEPPSASEGDMWIDTSTSNRTSRKFIRGSFRTSATEGGIIGENIRDILGVSQGDQQLKNTRQEWDDVQDAGTTRPSNNATIGARQGIDFFRSDGIAKYTEDEFENLSITLNAGGFLNNIGTSTLVQNTKINVNVSTGAIDGIGIGNGIFVDNVRQEWDDVQDANTTRPANNATRQFNRGVFVLATVYTLGDVVFQNGSSFEYINDTDSAGNTPPNATFWNLLSQAGNFKDLKFTSSDTLPATPVGDNPVGWSDSIPAIGTRWQSIATKTFEGVLVGVWSPPVLFGGVYRGTWNSIDTYHQGDSVSHDGRTFILTVTNSINNVPPITNISDAFWDLLSAKGDTGAAPTGAFTDTATHSTGGVLNMRALANGLGYDGVSDATFTVTVSASISAGAGTNDAITTGSWPTGPTIDLTLIINTGVIIRAGGGNGGDGGSLVGSGFAGGKGGDGINLDEDLTITLNGTSTVSGGSGGGGGGAGHLQIFPFEEEGNGGGGGGGFPNGFGGSGGGFGATAGGNGTVTSGGAGGIRSDQGSNGGAGGGVSGITPANGFNGGSSPSRGGGNRGFKGDGIKQNGNVATISGTGTHSGLGA